LAVADIRGAAQLVEPHLAIIDCADPDDNRILEAAVAGHADYIVTGDKRHLLRMKAFRGIEMITVNDFLRRLSDPSSER
jgi:predicted nucleic acid-binding protein